jgi:large repetitive protein
VINCRRSRGAIPQLLTIRFVHILLISAIQLLGQAAFSTNCPGVILVFNTNVNDAGCNTSTGSIVIQNVLGGSGNYTFSLNNGPAQTPVVAPFNEFAFSGLSSGNYSITISDGTCDTTITVNVATPAGILQASAATTATPCTTNTGSIIVTFAPLLPSPSQFALNTGTTNTNGVFNGLSQGTYSVEITDANGCTFTVNNISVSQTPSPTALDLNVKQIACLGGTGSITITGVTGGNSPYRYSVNGSAFQNKLVWDGLSPGTYIVVVMDNNGCTFTRNVVINQNNSTVKDCDAGEDITIPFGELAQLNGNGGSGTSFLWSPGLLVSDSTILNPIAFPEKTTVFTLTSISGDGCTCIDKLTVIVSPPLMKIPNTFTPNGDGINDTWIIDNIGFYESINLFIYNRNGDLIYTKKNFGAGDEWDGNYDGKPVPPANYYFVLEFKFPARDERYTYTGSITVIR